MKSEGPLKHFLLAFLLAVVCYAVLYQFIEHRRTRRGPWEVTFTNTPPDIPTIIINQPRLTITNVQVRFVDRSPAVPLTTNLGTFVFSQAQPVPFDVSFGRCVLLDTTFLPGTVTLQLFGHEIELLPRVLVIDHQEHPWTPNDRITLHPRQGESPR
jgi:hypothetical protein